MKHFYIYMMYNNKDELLYIGQTKNLKQRFQTHFTKAILETEPWKKDVCYIDTFECKTEYDMRILEIYLIGKLKPKYNKEFAFDDEVTLTIKINKINYKRYLMYDEKDLKISSNLDEILSREDVENKIKNNVIIYEGKLNNNYTKKKDKRINEFSYLWFNNRATEGDVKQICLNITNYFKNITKSKSNKNLLILQDQSILEILNKNNIQGCVKGVRFFNQNFDETFNNRNNIIYLINDFTYGYDDIRNITYLVSLLNYMIDNSDEKINLYLPSKRMRELFFEWLNN